MSDQSDDMDSRKFHVTGIEKTEPPAGMTEDTWYLYTIGQGPSAIRGKRSGSLSSVREYAEEFAENLNRRAALGYSAYAARRLQK